MNPETELRKWLDQASAELKDARSALTEAQRRVSHTEERRDLLRQLISLEENDGKANAAPVRPTHVEEDESSFIDAVSAIIRERGEPTHIGDLHDELVEREIPIPGKGAQANIIARIQRSDGKVIRVGRGLYGLPELGIDEAKPMRRRKSPKKGA